MHVIFCYVILFLILHSEIKFYLPIQQYEQIK